MELADSRLIDQLQAAYATRRSKPAPLKRTRMAAFKTKPNDYVTPASKNRRCRCGVCRACQDNARWERIFAEKFADPNYYSGPVVHGGSPLHHCG